jgi:hypothetical protein
MKALISVLIIVMILIVGISFVGRLLSPFAGLLGGTSHALTGKDSDATRSELPPIEEIANAPKSVQEKARQKSWDGGNMYAVQVSQSQLEGRPIITVELDFIPSRNPEVNWIAVSRKYSWIQIGDLTLNPISIEDAADLDSTLKLWADNSGGLGKKAAIHLKAFPGSERVIAGRPHKIKLSFQPPKGFALSKDGAWQRLYILGMTNQNFDSDHQVWSSREADAQQFPTWDADLCIPGKFQNR